MTPEWNHPEENQQLFESSVLRQTEPHDIIVFLHFCLCPADSITQPTHNTTQRNRPFQHLPRSHWFLPTVVASPG